MVTVAFHLPDLKAGGIERVVVNVIRHMDRGRFRPVLILRRRRGVLLDSLPEGVEVLSTGGRRALFSARTLAERIRSCGAQVVYSGTNAANLAALAARRLWLRRIPVVVSEHTPPTVFLREAKLPTLRKAAMRLLYPTAAAVAVPLADVGRELRAELGLPRLRLVVLRNPVVTEELAELAAKEPEVPLPQGSPLLVSSGRLVRAKGFDLLIRAFGGVLESYPDACLVILGEGPEREKLETLARSLGVSARVWMPGTVRNPFAVLRKADLFLQSSRREGFGNVLVEAMACGTPVVAADCPYGPKSLLEGGAGILVPPESPGALAEAAIKLLRDPKLMEELRTRARERASQYEAGAATKDFERLFLDLAGR